MWILSHIEDTVKNDAESYGDYGDKNLNGIAIRNFTAKQSLANFIVSK